VRTPTTCPCYRCYQCRSRGLTGKLLEQCDIPNCDCCVLPMAVGADLASRMIPFPDVPDTDVVAAYAKLVVNCSTSASTRSPRSCVPLARSPSKPRFRAANSLALPMPAGPTTSLRAAARCAMSSSVTARPCRGNRISLPSSLSPLARLSSSSWPAASCAQEVNFCRKLATELGLLGFIQPGPTLIAEDNTGAIALLEHGHFKGRSRHVHLCWCFVFDYIDTGVIRLVQTPSHDQLANNRTKACLASASAPQLKFQRSLLRGCL